jgi:hypothetical protein
MPTAGKRFFVAKWPNINELFDFFSQFLSPFIFISRKVAKGKERKG